MRFEKLNENKIRITLTHQDLVEKDIDFHSFMANSIDSQDLFFDVLDEAEREIGFVTKNYQIRIEALAIADGDFVLTITRSLPDSTANVTTNKRKVQVKRKKCEYQSSQLVYEFSTFDDFCNFVSSICLLEIPINSIAKNIVLYEYKTTYYLVLNKINLNYPFLRKFCSSIVEFSTYKTNSALFIPKLAENGKLIMKHNALKTAIKYFIHK